MDPARIWREIAALLDFENILEHVKIVFEIMPAVRWEIWKGAFVVSCKQKIDQV